MLLCLSYTLADSWDSTRDKEKIIVFGGFEIQVLQELVAIRRKPAVTHKAAAEKCGAVPQRVRI